AVWGDLDQRRAEIYISRSLRLEHARVAAKTVQRRVGIFSAARRMKRLELVGVVPWETFEESLVDAALICAPAQPGHEITRTEIRRLITEGAIAGAKQATANPPKPRPKLAGGEEAIIWLAALDSTSWHLPGVHKRTAQVVADHLRGVFIREDGSL